MFKRVLLTSLILSGIAFSVPAQASGFAYVCSVQYTPTPSVFGQNGYLYVSFNDKPFCKGVAVDYGNFCTPGSATLSCNPTYPYELVALMSLRESLHKAAVDGTQVFVSSGIGASGNWVSFRGNQ